MRKLSQSEVIGVTVALFVAFGFLFFGKFIFGVGQISQTSSNQPAAVVSGNDVSAPASTGLSTEDTLIGNGAEAKNGDTVSIHYTGTLVDGTKFDSSRDRGTPIQFTLGSGQVIPGFEKGILGMKVGGTRKITIPPELGYGSQAVGPIPANSTLIFDVELVAVGN